MSDEKDDLELEALQRRLDDAFATTRPRRDFEDELWLRMQARRPFGARLRDALAGLVAGFREAPAIPLGAVALVLIVAVGIGVLASGGLHPNQNATSGAFSQAAPDVASGEFGRLPTPVLHAAVAPIPNAATQLPAYLAPSNLYLGPATLRWTGQMPLGSVQAPVFRYTEPSAVVAEQFAASMGASTTKEEARVGFLGTYAGQDFSVTFESTAPQLPREPYFMLMQTDGPHYYGGNIEPIVNGFLARYGLTPSWSYVSSLNQSGNAIRVDYLRTFSLPGEEGAAFLIDGTGERYGIEVDLLGGQVRSASGPLPLDLDSAYYPLIANDRAVGMALQSAPVSSQGIQPVPAVDLSRVELVYALAVANGQGFYEPVYMFSGTFQYNGQTYTKRVLVPLVDPSQRR